MHWFWRATIAVAVSAVVVIAGGAVLERNLHYLQSHIARNMQVGGMLAERFVAGWVVWQLPIVLLALLVYSLLTTRYPSRTQFDETRCRKCNYILRGLTQPRCPECGEAI